MEDQEHQEGAADHDGGTQQGIAGLGGVAETIAVNTAEDVIEKATNTTTPAASAGVVIDWVIRSLEQALGLGGFAATSDAVKAHVEDLKKNKDALSQAVAAGS